MSAQIPTPRAAPANGTRIGRRRRRRVVRAAGGSMILLGLAIFAHLAYEFWGTGLATAHAQTTLRAQLRHGFPARPIRAGADGIIRIPKIAVDVAFVEGVDTEDLAKGPGHYPDTPLPGAGGNVAIAGHRTTHAAPFWALDALRPGDRIFLRTRAGSFTYMVQWVRVFSQEAWSVTQLTGLPSLTLTTCNPRFSSAERLVVRAVQIDPSPFAAPA